MNKFLRLPAATALALGTAFALTIPAQADPLEVGAAAPEVQGLDQNGNEIELSELYQDNHFVLVYFYPRAGTAGCTDQACSLRDSYEELQERGVTVVGVSNDGLEAQASFAENQNLPFILLADEENVVIDAFGVPHDNGAAARQAFLVEDGKVIWRDTSASTTQQAADVLAVLNERESTEGEGSKEE